MDKTVLNAYGWEDIDLAHDFYDYSSEGYKLRFLMMFWIEK